MIKAVGFLLLSFVAKAQNPEIATTADKQRIVIGEPLQYKVEAIFPVNTYKITWLNFPDSIAHFEVIERQKTDTIESNGMLRVQQLILLTSFDSGKRSIPSFALNFKSVTEDSTFNVLTDSLPVSVLFSPMDSTKSFHDIKTIILVKDQWPLWLWIAAELSAILLIILVYYLYKKYRKRKSPELFTSRFSPLEEALHSLRELKQQKLLIKQQVKLFHSSLGDIFKRYLARKTNSLFLNLTTMEVLLKLNEMYIGKEDISLAANNLRMTDAVKFAKYIPGTIESEEALSNTGKVIEQIDRSSQKK